METNNNRTKELFQLLKAKDKKQKTLLEIEDEEAQLSSTPRNKKANKNELRRKKNAHRSVKSDIRRIEDRIQNEYSDLMNLAQSPGLCGLSLLLKKSIR